MTALFLMFPLQLWPVLEATPFRGPFSSSSAFGWWWNTLSDTAGEQLGPKAGTATPPSCKGWSTLRGEFRRLRRLWVSFPGDRHFFCLNFLNLFVTFVGCYPVTGILVEQFYPGGPIAHLYDAENHSWVKLMNWQHCTMYLFFGISGVSLIVTKRFQLTALRVDCLTLSLALFMEGMFCKTAVPNPRGAARHRSVG